MKIENVISLGLGVQSTVLYYMSSMGELPRADVAIFADLGREKMKTIAYLKYLQQWQKEFNGIPIIVIQKRNLYKDLLNSENSTGQKFSSIPAFTKNDDGSRGMLRRQCTNEYKIEQVDKEIRNLLQVKRLTGKTIYVWKGITLEEIERLSIPDSDWKTHIYPFCGYVVSKSATEKYAFGKKMTRNDTLNWYTKNNLPIPPKSSCVFCPYQSDASWYDMKINEPEDFDAAVKVDHAIRNSTKKGIKQLAYLHNSCMPLDQIEFKQGLPDLWHGECSGNCHI
jgi:hypothetical protein